jgi:hypothetical protein
MLIKKTKSQNIITYVIAYELCSQHFLGMVCQNHYKQ